MPYDVTVEAYFLHQHPPLSVENKIIGRVKQHICHMKAVDTGSVLSVLLSVTFMRYCLLVHLVCGSTWLVMWLLVEDSAICAVIGPSNAGESIYSAWSSGS